MPKVSVIIPVYNVEKYLRQCLDSVVNQTLQDIEIICVNDCSPDNSLEILEEYKKKDNRIKIIDLKENGGLGNARNVAIKEVTAETIMFLDSDDWLEIDSCELAYEQISKNNNDFVIFGSYVHSMKTKKRKYDYAKLANFVDIKDKSNAKISEIKIPFWSNAECWYKIYSTKFFKGNYLEFDRGAFEDQRFNIRIYALAQSISILDKPLYNYRKRDDSITSVSLNWKDFIEAKKRAYELIKNIKLPSDDFKDFYVIYLIESILFYFFKYTKRDKRIKRDFYSEIQHFFSVLNKENDIENIREQIDYKVFKLVVKNKTYTSFKVKKLINGDLFSIQNSKKGKVVTILGIKCKRKIERNK